MLQKLIELRNEIFAVIGELTDEQLNVKPNSDKWSMVQILHHLYTAEQYGIKQLKKGLKHETNKIENKNLQFLSDRTDKRKSPVDPPTDFMTKQQMTSMLVQSRQELEQILASIDLQTLEDKSVNHLAFGPISLKNMVDFIYYHEQRHLEQMKELIAFL
ncbi:DinB family protein [Bacillus aquiflavi]|uniref:DinB family protein n=1 Tax=Bacillus aquiflavi TaxID=2672567 RepID=A0A6B3W504_9BACI|nr:DinB family protein [Bacillus aquiflavi]MBA4538683.1 DinB family protein [Bacillus aquiflavi]NEY83043.1 DinB family protein [Bacillus aquiflavi]UAC48012.1 DinB family protein [Bacillus aquiflavi]